VEREGGEQRAKSRGEGGREAQGAKVEDIGPCGSRINNEASPLEPAEQDGTQQTGVMVLRFLYLLSSLSSLRSSLSAPYLFKEINLRNAHQVRAGVSLLRDARERVDRAVLADGDRVDVQRPLPVLVEHRAVVRVPAGRMSYVTTCRFSSPFASPLAVALFPVTRLPST